MATRRTYLPALLFFYGSIYLFAVSFQCHITAVVAVALSSSRKSNVFLAKTKETFKLAELQFLEFDIQMSNACTFGDSSNNIGQEAAFQHLLVDSATGSSLLGFELEEEGGNSYTQELWNYLLNLDRNTSAYFPAAAASALSSLARCDWISLVLAQGSSPQDLCFQLEQWNKGSSKKVNLDLWTLDYLCMQSSSSSRQRRNRSRRPYTQKTLLCAISQALFPAKAALDPAASLNQLVLVETVSEKRLTYHNNGDDNSMFYLVKRLPELRPLPSLLSSSYNFLNNWRNRPFPYSSSMNPAAAEIVVDLLISIWQSKHQAFPPNITDDNDPPKPYVQHQIQQQLRLLDPTCGSGTFLAYAIERGMHVTGWDISSTCIQGCKANLEHLLVGDSRRLNSNNNDNVLQDNSCYELELRDSSRLHQDRHGSSADYAVDCLACNLPWGLNTAKCTDENVRILQGLHKMLPPGVPCAFVAKENLQPQLQKIGYRVLGQAHIPQRNFDLPQSEKKKKKKGADENQTQQRPQVRKGRSDCIITIAET